MALAVAQALTRDAVDAEDLVQDTYLKAYRHWHTFEPGSDCRRWLSAICRNTFFAQRARQRWVTAVGDDLELETFAAVSLHKLAREEAADVLAIPIGTVRSRLYRARRQLQEALVQYAIDAGFSGASTPSLPTHQLQARTTTHAES